MKRAFTLIELLIVVAIIAILAAIAVPNFLEAQTRAKVSRCRTDMRTIGVALESYSVDNNKYPTDSGSGQVVADSTARTNGYTRIGVITTPVAYLTTIPQDCFLIVPETQRQWLRTFVYMCKNETNGYGKIRSTGDGGSSLWSAPDYIWLMISCGPDRVPNFAAVPPCDPTNGTVSPGDIWLFGPGAGFRGQL